MWLLAIDVVVPATTALSLVYADGGLKCEQGMLVLMLMGSQMGAFRGLGAEFSVGTAGDGLAEGVQVGGGQLVRQVE